MQEHRDEKRCRACGGKCCAIYLSWDKGGTYPDGQWWFEEWVSAWENAFEESGALNCGVEPLHEPLRTHMIHNYEGPLWAEVRARGGDPNYCQYWRYDVGCLLPWERRPSVCREYRCNEWIREEVVEHVDQWAPGLPGC